jgi:hypothetical protein
MAALRVMDSPSVREISDGEMLRAFFDSVSLSAPRITGSPASPQPERREATMAKGMAARDQRIEFLFSLFFGRALRTASVPNGTTANILVFSQALYLTIRAENPENHP